MKWTNPLYYPWAVLAGTIVLVVGVRLVNLPGWAMLPVAAGVATMGAVTLKAREPISLDLDNPDLEREFLAVRRQALALVDLAQSLRKEASQLLMASDQIDLLVMVQQACDHTQELPSRLDQLARRLQGGDSLLSANELQNQLEEVKTRMASSSGVAREQLQKLANSLERNIKLARAGSDARQAQVVSLSTLIAESAGVLQQLQNQLRSTNLTDDRSLSALRSLGQEFADAQRNVDLYLNPHIV